jgi:hypothetical protein
MNTRRVDGVARKQAGFPCARSTAGVVRALEERWNNVVTRFESVRVSAGLSCFVEDFVLALSGQVGQWTAEVEVC